MVNLLIIQAFLIFVLMVQIIKSSPINTTFTIKDKTDTKKTGRNLLLPLQPLPAAPGALTEDDLFMGLQSREEPDSNLPIPLDNNQGNSLIPPVEADMMSAPIPKTDDISLYPNENGEMMEAANTIVFRPLFTYRKTSNSRRRVSSNPNRRVSVYPYYYYYYYPVIRNPGPDRFPVLA